MYTDTSYVYTPVRQEGPFLTLSIITHIVYILRIAVLASLSAHKALAAAPPERPPPTSTPCQRNGFARPLVRTRADHRTPHANAPSPPMAAHRLCAWRRGCRCCWHRVGMGWHGLSRVAVGVALLRHATGVPSLFFHVHGATCVSRASCLVTLYVPASSPPHAFVCLLQVPKVHAPIYGEASVQPFVVLVA